MREVISNIFRIYALILLVIFSWVNINILHWKTFYQTLISQVLIYILWEIYNYKKYNKFFIFSSVVILLSVTYWTILSSLINSITVDFYKLGRYAWHIDFFKYSIGLIPLIIAFSVSKYKDLSRAYIYLILLLTSISFYYTFLDVPEISLFLSVPLLIETKTNRLSYFNPILILSLLFMLMEQIVFGHISFYGYGILCNLLLAFAIINQRQNVSINFYILLIVIGAIHIITRQYINQGSLEFFSKDSSSILNSNRVSGYYVLFIPIALKLINFNKFNRFTLKGILIFVLISTVLLFQFSRGAIAGCTLSTLFFIVFNIFKQKKNNIYYSLYFYYHNNFNILYTFYYLSIR
jgi:hypothetical protein